MRATADLRAALRGLAGLKALVAGAAGELLKKQDFEAASVAFLVMDQMSVMEQRLTSQLQARNSTN